MTKKLAQGDVVTIDLGNGLHSYAQLSSSPLVVFFDGQTTKEIPLLEIIELPVAFKIFVSSADFKSGRWQVVGRVPVTPEHLRHPLMYKQDAISGRLSVYHETDFGDDYEKESLLSDCRHLECAAVWEVDHIESRLRDYFAGVENNWVTLMAIVEDGVPADQRR